MSGKSAALVGVMLALLGCQRERIDPKLAGQESYAVLSPSAKVLLNKEELIKMKRKALDGNQEAAAVVVEHYLGASTTLSSDQLYWLSIASENGAEGEMYNYALALMEKGGVENCIRANFWLKRIARSTTATEIKKQAKDVADTLLTDSRCARSP